MPLWTDAYLGDTTHLTTTEHGAYMLLLMAAWRTKTGSLPDDDRLLARFARMTPAQWKKARPVIVQFYTVEDGMWIQGRLKDERDAVKQKSKRQSSKAKSRWLKNKETDKPRHEPGIAEPMPPLTLPLPLTLPNIEKGEEKKYEFLGETIRLTKPDYDRFRKRAHHLPEDQFKNAIFDADKYYTANPSEKGWFHKLGPWLDKQKRIDKPKQQTNWFEHQKKVMSGEV